MNWLTIEEIKKKNFECVSIVVHVTKAKKNYSSSFRNEIKSKKFSNLTG